MDTVHITREQEALLVDSMIEEKEVEVKYIDNLGDIATETMIVQSMNHMAIMGVSGRNEIHIAWPNIMRVR